MFRKKQIADEDALNQMALFLGAQKQSHYDKGYEACKADMLAELQEMVAKLTPPGERKLIEAPVEPPPAPPEPEPSCSIEALFAGGYKGSVADVLEKSGKRPAQVRKTLNALMQAGKIKKEGNLFLGTKS